MNDIKYITDEGSKLDEIDTMNYIVLRINDLKRERLSYDDILYSILSDDSFVGDRKKLTEFVERVLQNIIRAI
ncbi:hypothetical protein [Sanguibacteroides sp. AM78-02pH3A]|uniref:hypothetical protein n=1 Tax=Sanguibacteroides sp. AM78-02pH3A TaxID=3002646 RepID=UPI0022E773E3|nr:hypothetical protein [Sanguibacteroides sp. AM78-02pH3A]